MLENIKISSQDCELFLFLCIIKKEHIRIIDRVIKNERRKH